MKPALFKSFTLRGTTFSNRIAVSPMCQYSSVDGFANNWHLVHIGSRAISNPGLIIMEAAAITPEGRISPQDLGIWKDDHISKLKEIVEFVHEQSNNTTKIGIQIAHAGRKASTHRPFDKEYGGVSDEEGGWEPFGASAVAYNPHYRLPKELSVEEIEDVVNKFVDAAKRCIQAGFDMIEIHGAHGYLLHSFYSPKSNTRTDGYGGSFEGRIKLIMEVTERVRATIPSEMPLFVRLSATEFSQGGFDIDDTVKLASRLKEVGADLIDTSAGGNSADQKIEVKPSYQVPYSERIRKEAGIPTGAVGLITEAHQANEIVESGKADLVLMAREFLREPYWTFKAAKELGYTDLHIPPQYGRAIDLK
jgi:2,4-dienoyl-CoA reductase-like NADH-dependent reductase (Old Yellow Enzyme family)